MDHLSREEQRELLQIVRNVHLTLGELIAMTAAESAQVTQLGTITLALVADLQAYQAAVAPILTAYSPDTVDDANLASALTQLQTLDTAIKTAISGVPAAVSTLAPTATAPAAPGGTTTATQTAVDATGTGSTPTA